MVTESECSVLACFPPNNIIKRLEGRIVVQAPRRPFTRSVEFPKVALLAHRTRTRP